MALIIGDAPCGSAGVALARGVEEGGSVETEPPSLTGDRSPRAATAGALERYFFAVVQSSKLWSPKRNRAHFPSWISRA
jgi:hypothetical protein